MKNIPFLVVLSTGPAIPIDADEVEKVIQARLTGSDAALRRGMFNPSFYVSLVLDDKRISSFKEDLQYMSESRRVKILEIGPQKLKSVFLGMENLGKKFTAFEPLVRDNLLVGASHEERKNK